MNNPDLSVNIGGIELKNPVLTASGTFGYGEEYSDYVDLNRLGGIVVKGLSLEPYEGNPPPRIVETPAGMLNSIGLQNIGLNAFINEKMPFLRRYDTKVIVNFFGMTMNQYSEFASKVSDVDGVAGLEMNISCPNLDKGGMIFGVDPGLTHKVVSAVRKATTLPLIVKLSPNVTDITVIAMAAADAGADALSLINTLLGMAIDIDSGRPKLANITGGLSGPAIRPVALRMVWEAAKAIDLPIIGVGGIMTANHAIEFMIAGAHAVQVGTASFVDPESSIKIVDGIEAYCRDKGLTGVGELVGSLRT
ncbi:MAG: dihydroorotate dehydrogenase [Nitrospinota bacterium]